MCQSIVRKLYGWNRFICIIYSPNIFFVYWTLNKTYFLPIDSRIAVHNHDDVSSSLDNSFHSFQHLCLLFFFVRRDQINQSWAFLCAHSTHRSRSAAAHHCVAQRWSLYPAMSDRCVCMVMYFVINKQVLDRVTSLFFHFVFLSFFSPSFLSF